MLCSCLSVTTSLMILSGVPTFPRLRNSGVQAPSRLLCLWQGVGKDMFCIETLHYWLVTFAWLTCLLVSKFYAIQNDGSNCWLVCPGYTMTQHQSVSISTSLQIWGLFISVFWLWLLCDLSVIIRTELLLIVTVMIFMYTPTTLKDSEFFFFLSLPTWGELDRVVAWQKMTCNPHFCTLFDF